MIFLVISGDESISLPMIALGAVGLISAVANAHPQKISDMIRLCLAGNFEAARSLHFSMTDFDHLMFAEGNPAGVKTALKYLKFVAIN